MTLKQESHSVWKLLPLPPSSDPLASPSQWLDNISSVAWGSVNRQGPGETVVEEVTKVVQKSHCSASAHPYRSREVHTAPGFGASGSKVLGRGH